MSESEKQDDLPHRLTEAFRFADALNYAARLRRDYVALNVVPTGSGSGQISRNPEGESYEKGQVVSLTATADTDSKFTGWSGDAAGSQSVCNLRMNEAKSVIANFECLSDKSQNMLATHPTLEKRIGDLNEFIDHGDGTVTDTRSGLMWMRPAIGQNWSNGSCTGVAKLFSSSEANQFQSDFAGHHDWRIPTIEELKSLIFEGRTPALDESAFPVQSGRYFWSSSRNISDGRKEFQERTMIFALRSGVVGYTKEHPEPEHLRLVRRNALSNSLSKTPESQQALNPKQEPSDNQLNRETPSEVAQAISKYTRDGTVYANEARKGNFGHFLDHDDGTATDTRTGLMWMRAAIGQSWKGYTCIGQPRRFGLIDARDIASGVAGHFDWRLPSVAELASLICGKSDRDFGNLVFPSQSGDGRYFWTDSGQRINPDLKNGTNSDFKDTDPYGFVRLVRSDNHLNIATDTIGNGNGTISRRPASDNYAYGVIVTLTARANVGSKFRCWHGDASGLSAKFNVTMDSAKTVSAEFVALESFTLDVTTSGTGRGRIDRNIDSPSYLEGTEVTLTALAEDGSIFKGWNGDVIMIDDAIVVTVDSAYSISAEFVVIENFSLITVSMGTGAGEIERSLVAKQYVEGTRITLTARAAAGSKFKCWHGDTNGRGGTCEVTMDSTKAISAEFVALESFPLDVTATGTGRGKIKRSIDSPSHFAGTKVTLTALAEESSRFNGWHGDVTMMDDAIIVTMDSAYSISAEFVALESFPLDVTATGTGLGKIDRSIDSSSYFAGTEVTLTALAEKGSIFNGWHGDVSGIDDTVTVTLNAAMSIDAEFIRVNIADTEITAKLTSVKSAEVKRGQLATVFNIVFRNTGDEQVRIKVPLTNYVSQSGQTSEQSGWAAGHINGSKGISLSAGTFCEMGLVHSTQPVNGDRLYVVVEYVQSSTRISFTFQCIGKSIWLVNSTFENDNEAPISKANHPGMINALKRIESLENTLAEVLRRLDAIQLGLPMARRNNPSNQTVLVQTLSEVLAWLAEHERVGVAELRMRLLPLDLLPSAVIEEINERALDLTGELAVSQVGDEIVVVSAVFSEVLSNWDTGQS
jgi:hypothetical protein